MYKPTEAWTAAMCQIAARQRMRSGPRLVEVVCSMVILACVLAFVVALVMVMNSKELAASRGKRGPTQQTTADYGRRRGPQRFTPSAPWVVGGAIPPRFPARPE